LIFNSAQGAVLDARSPPSSTISTTNASAPRRAGDGSTGTGTFWRLTCRSLPGHLEDKCATMREGRGGGAPRPECGCSLVAAAAPVVLSGGAARMRALEGYFADPHSRRLLSGAVMKQELTSIRASVRTPRAAAIAGSLFSVLLIAALSLLQRSVPADPLEAGRWLESSSNTVALALNLVPFAGIAFLWFIGVLRDRLGEREDRFFATVFLGSGLLFLAMLFNSAALVGGIVIAYSTQSRALLDSATFTFARAATFEIMNIYAIRMAAVFMISASTLAIRTGFIPRWLAFLGYALASLLLLSSRSIESILLVFPLWVLLISIYILIDNLRRPSARTDQEPHARGNLV